MHTVEDRTTIRVLYYVLDFDGLVFLSEDKTGTYAIVKPMKF